MSDQTTAGESLWDAYGRVLDKVPNFVTDEKANAGNRGIYKYLNLGTILKTVKPIFTAEGLHFYQRVDMPVVTPDGRSMSYGCVRTMIFGHGDKAEVSAYPFAVSGDPQAMGSQITYARRYSLYAALGIYPDKDDDGAAAREYYQRQTAPAPGGISAEAARTLSTMAKQRGVNIFALASQLKGHQVTKLRELTPEDGATLTAMIANGGNGNAQG